MYDVCIIGRGPAGVSAAIYLARAGKQTVVVSKNGGALEKADVIENYYGFSTPVKASELAAAGVAQAKALGASFVDDEVVALEFASNGYNTVCRDGVIEARAVIICCGAKRETLRVKGLDRFEGAGVSYCVTCDGRFYRGRRVGLVGGGEYMLHELTELRAFTDDITVFTEGSDVACDAETVKDRITAAEGTEKLEAVVAGGKRYPLDGLFLAIGTAGAADFARTLGVITEGDTIVTDGCATNLPGLFAAGDCTRGLKQIAKAVSDGANAAMAAIAYLRGN